MNSTAFERKMQTKTLHIQTIGCQLNVYDSEKIAAELYPLGYRLGDAGDDADMVVVNTCAIREKAEQKVFSYLGRLAEQKKRHPGMIIAVGGCVAQQEGVRIIQRAPAVDIVFGTHAIGRLPRMVQTVAHDGNRQIDVGMDRRIDDDLPVAGTGGISRFVTVMHGCDNYCTYCVVPYVRGRESSRRPERIIAEIRNLVRGGTREVTLLGQNVNSYGIKEGLPSFSKLLEMIDAIDGLVRIRFTTSHPKDLSASLIGCFGRLEKLCRHIHLPVQSGADPVLKRMNRKYTRAAYLEKVDRLRGQCPDIGLTTDIIVGFPGETEADFHETLDLLDTVGFDGIFAFKYSDRPNAPAARFSQKIPEALKKERLQSVLSCQEAITKRKHNAAVNGIEAVLVEGTSRVLDTEGLPVPPGTIQWMGRSSGNRIVHFVAAPPPETGPSAPAVGEVCPVRIERAFQHSLWGRWINEGDRAIRRKGDQSHAA